MRLDSRLASPQLHGILSHSIRSRVLIRTGVRLSSQEPRIDRTAKFAEPPGRRFKLTPLWANATIFSIM